MALSKLEFTKSWKNKSDFPTYEADETQVRDDMQLLHDETKTFINNMIDSLDAAQIPMDAADAAGGTIKSAIESAVERDSGVNPNILYNWDFANPVNQRGNSSYGAVGYCLDGWYFNPISDDLGTLTVNDGYISLTGFFPTTLQQIFEKALPNGTYTISAVLRGTGSGTIGIGKYDPATHGTHYGSLSFEDIGSDWTLISETFIYDPLETTKYPANTAIIGFSPGAAYDIKCIKLEKGEKSTLHLEPPARYTDELLKCQRYYLPLAEDAIPASGYVKSTTQARVLIPTPVQMKTDAQLAITNYGTVYASGKSGIVPTAATLVSAGATGLCVDLTISGGTSGDPIVWCGFAGVVCAEQM